jgi:glycosyltransferase involved in cell wall biosynthesis
LGDRVQLIGSVADPLPVFHAADALVLTSRTEGMPGVLVEAGLCGLPAVATDVGGVSEIVTTATGRLVPVGDSAAVAEGIRAVLAQPDLGPAARARCLARFDLDVVTDGWRAVLASAVRTS